jgi:hypothetical protein
MSRRARTLKLNKAFAPLPRRDDDEFYPNGIFEFNVTRILAFIEENHEKFPVEMVSVDSLYHYSPDHLDEETIKSANLKNPILLAEISPGRFNVIDGNHRVERAKRDGVAQLPARRVSPEHHVPFLTTVRGYQAYIGYWNEKLDQLGEGG